MSLGIMYSLCGRKQETDRKVKFLYITNEGCNLEYKKKQRAIELPFCKSKPNKNLQGNIFFCGCNAVLRVYI
jgi:hypothetical protein